MLRADRLQALMKRAKLSQNELARRVGVSQPTIYRMVHGHAYGSTRLHRVAAELKTTAAYLTGESDDPDANAPPPPREPTIQHIMMPVALPAERALTRMFLGLLQSLDVPNADALAPELAKLLPIGLQTLKGPLRIAETDSDGDVDDIVEVPRPAARGRRRASRT